MLGRPDGKLAAYNSALKSEGECCCSVSELDGTARIRVVIGHGTKECGGLNAKKSKIHILADGFSGVR
jgi:hypothetical protein